MREKIFVLIVVMAYPTFAQIQHGTILIFNVAKDELVVAADSRQTDIQTHGPPNDSYCKIAAFGSQTIFTSVGAPGVSAPVSLAWNNVDVARAIIKSSRANGVNPVLHDIVVGWGNSIKSHWQAAYGVSRNQVLEVAEGNGGQLTSGMFAQVEGGEIHMEGAAIGADKWQLAEPITLVIGTMNACWPCGKERTVSKICAAGKTITIAEEFCRQQNPDFSPSSLLSNRIGIEAALAIRIADLTIAYDNTGEIGGRVDAIKLSKDGSLRWLARKDNCPENQD